MVALVPASAFAQGRRGGGAGGRTRARRSVGVVWNEGSTILLFQALLNLTDAQIETLTEVFDTAAETASPVATAANAGKNALFEAAKSGKSDDEIEAIAKQQGALTTQLQALQARTFVKMWALLTDEQKAKVNDSI